MLNQLFGNLFGRKQNKTPPQVQEPSPPLSDADLESLFTQLLLGVQQSRGKQWAQKWLKNIEHRVTTERWVEWLRRFGERLLASPVPNNQLAGQLVQLGELGIGEVGDVAYNIGMLVLSKIPGEPIWEYDGPDAEPIASADQEGGEDSQSVEFDQFDASGELLVEEETNRQDAEVAKEEEEVEAWFDRGNRQYQAGDFEGAIISFDEAIKIKPDYDPAWNNRGIALDKLGRFEDAIASYDKAIEIKPDFYQACYNRGVALGKLGRFEDAITSYDKAIEIKPDYYQAWYNQSVTLDKLGRYEQAIASYDQVIEIKPDFYQACYNRGVALSNLGRYEQAIASYDEAIKIKPDCYTAWYGRGFAAGNSVSCDTLLAWLSPIARQNPHLNQRGYEGRLASYEEGLKYCQQDTHPEGWGMLHQEVGNAHYFRGSLDSHPRPYWRKAVNSYNQALITLTQTDFPQLHLEVLQDLIRALLGLGQIAEAEELRRRGTDLLQRLLKETNRSEHSKKQLALEFAGFGQLTVDLAVQSGDLVKALELAEQGKNACLSWLLDAWSEEVSSPSWEDIKQLLNPTTAVVYWHLSPAALHTFILKHDAPAPILITPSTQTTEEVPAAVRRWRDFENWVKDWNQKYAEISWRGNLPQMLKQLANILDITTIVQLIQGSKKIQNLILIPHRDLHRFPLHALFPDDFTISYLPSVQMGINLSKKTRVEGHLLSVEHPNNEDFSLLHYAPIESAVITQLFNNPIPKRIAEAEATQTAVKEALKDRYSIFHFAGHSIYNFYNPKQSALALSGKDYLTLEAICQIDNLSSYQLVSLSACETGITGNQTITTEYVGLVSAFLYQGVTNVVSTLWTVTDYATSFLMIYFYRQLKKGKSPDVALAKATKWLRNLTNRKLEIIYKRIFAQLPKDEMPIRPFVESELTEISQMELSQKQQKLFDEPYYWAAFTITGR